VHGEARSAEGEACGSSRRGELRIGRVGSHARCSDPCTGGHSRPADRVIAAAGHGWISAALVEKLGHTRSRGSNECVFNSGERWVV